MDKWPIWLNGVKICGRTIWQNGTIYLGYSAASIEFSTDGAQVQAELEGIPDGRGGGWPAYMGVVLNGSEELYKKIEIKDGVGRYGIYENRRREKVDIRLVKLTEAQYGKVGIRGLFSDGHICPAECRKRKILFIGDSITAGAGVEGKDGITAFSTKDENVLKSYAWLAARQLDAQCHVIAWGGIGIISRYVPLDRDKPLTDYLMPQLFQYTDRSLEETLGRTPLEIWDPRRFMPQVVVVNLGTNDASFTRGIGKREELFAKGYGDFLRQIRKDYREAYIFVVYGLMEKTLSPVISRMVAGYKKDARDTMATYVEFPKQDPRDGLGTGGHPGPLVHKKAADALAAAIREGMSW